MSTASTVTEHVIYLALELSRSTWLAALRRPGAAKVVLHRLDGGNTTGLLAFIAAQRTQAEVRLGAAVEVISCLEAGRDGFWLHRLLLANGVASHIVEPTSILVSPRARRGPRPTAWTPKACSGCRWLVTKAIAKSVACSGCPAPRRRTPRAPPPRAHAQPSRPPWPRRVTPPSFVPQPEGGDPT